MSFSVRNMCKDVKQIFETFMIDKENCNNLHVLRFYSSYVVVRDGKAIEVTDPYMEYCPLAEHFYGDICKAGSLETRKETIKKVINEKINKFGFFTEKRELFGENIAVP